MNDRLQQFLTLENLTPSSFADRLGIQRSRISHVLSGRNKPSYDFIERFMKRFPNVNLEWLITGKGKVYKDFSDETGAGTIIKNDFQFSDNKENTHPMTISEPVENELFESKAESSTEKRDIVRITVFYSDGSFEEFYK